MIDHEHQLQKLEVRVKELTEEKVRKTEQLRLLREQRDQVIKELEQLGLTPQTVKAKIEALEQDVEQSIKNLNDQIPNE